MASGSSAERDAMSFPLGKIDPGAFERWVAPHLGAARPEVLVGPLTGVDSAIVRLSAGRVMAMTTDPLSYLPALGAEASARLACHLIASDLWTTGIPPAYAAVAFNLPPQMTDAEFGAYWEAMAAEWERLGVAVVTGHTGRYAGCDYTIIGAGTLVGVGDEGRTVGPAFARPGDRVILTKGCAVEATVVAARAFPGKLGERLDEEELERLRAGLDRVSVVADCRAALRAGVRDHGVSLLHDATEGGVLGALLEMARACGCDLRVERARIPLPPEVEKACEVMDVDPYWTLSAGTLIVTARADRADAVLKALAEEGIPAAPIGELVRGEGTLWLSEPGGQVARIRESRPDPYWQAYERAIREGWK